MEELFNLGLLLCLIAIGFIFGKINESNHYKSIIKREKDFLYMQTTSLKRLYGEEANSGELVSGSITVSADYFKRIIASLINLIGGRVTTYETLLDRGRREAILRMKADAKKFGYKKIINVRIETSSISGRSQKRDQISCVEVYAYGTGVK